MKTDPAHRPAASSLARASSRLGAWSVALAALALTACFPDFDLSDKIGCEDDTDCIEGNRCLRSGDELGQCVSRGFAGQNNSSNNAACEGTDNDHDLAFAGPGCVPNDCDDNDANRSPLNPEFCDGVDNDCDNIVDEGVRNGCGTCSALPTERCNGRDDDCDGVIDDDVLNACGLCGPVPVEFCDTDDNDCDGQIDEGLDCGCAPGTPDRACPTAEDNVTVCAQGVQSCVCPAQDPNCATGRWGSCRDLVLSCQDVCDLVDNDGNGVIDDGFALATDLENCGGCGVRCGNFQSASRCQGGVCTLNCLDGWVDADGDNANGCEYPCIPTTTQDNCEDGVDNDCDGEIDQTCRRRALGGTYTFFNLFGWSSEGLPPGVLVGTLDIDSPIGGPARVHDATLYLDELTDGSRAFNTPSERELVLTDDNGVELRPVGDEDYVGAIFRGAHTMDAQRSVIVFNEFSQQNNTRASVAVAVKQLPGDVPVTNRLLSGPSAAVQLLPGILLGAGTGAAANVFGLGLDADVDRGQGLVHTVNSSLGRQSFAVSQAPRVEYSIESGAMATVAVDGGGIDLLWTSQVAAGEGFGVGTIATGGTMTPSPGLVAFIPRGRPLDLNMLTGRWLVTGLQIAFDGESSALTYRAVHRRIQATRQNALSSELLEENGDALNPFGTASIVRESFGSVIELQTTFPSINGVDLVLRGLPTEDGNLMVLWEHLWEHLAANDGLATSVYFAIRIPSPGE